MRLSALLASLPEAHAPLQRTAQAADPIVRGLTYDSRAVSPGDAFFALRGAEVDGHDYLQQAIELGAAVVFVEEVPDGLDLGDCPAVVVGDARRAMAPIARHFFGAPSDELLLIGVTGTNGKTSVTYLVESILRQWERRVGLIARSRSATARRGSGRPIPRPRASTSSTRSATC